MALTIEKAQQILDDYYDLTHTKYEDDISLIRALEFLIQETKDPEYMVELGGWYYEQRQFDLAEEYYLMAASLEYVDAYECLGYIYYYGRVGQPDYKKAFHYYKLASDKGNLVASYKLADMYKNGYYVSKDYYEKSPVIKAAVDFIVSDQALAVGHKENLERLYNELLNKDWFMTLLDLEDYIATKDRMFADYEDQEKWKRMMVVNIAKAGFFSSDRTIAEYNRDIWKLK